ncbi:MAG: hypothetical protein R3C56_28825 [Pirellulaceae bacterium]
MPVPSAGVTNTLASHSLDVTSDVLPSWEVPAQTLGAMPEAESFPQAADRRGRL